VKKFLLGLLTGIVFCGLTVVLVALALMRFSARPPSIGADSVLMLRLEGDVPEKAPPEMPLPFLESRNPVALPDIWLALKKAAADPRIEAVVLEPRGVTAGWAKLEELQLELQQFKKSGKPMVAYLRNPGVREYYLASAAGRVLMAPQDSLDVKGLRLETMYFKDTLDKLGVTADVVHAGKYKDAGDMFTRTSMSPETKEVLGQVLDRYYGDLVDTIARARGKTADQVKEFIDQGPMSGQQALAGGWVDGVGFDDSVITELKRRLHEPEAKLVRLQTYVKVPAASVPGVQGPTRIALVVGDGMIVSGRGDSSFQDGLIVSGPIERVLRDVGSDPSIHGVILRVDSPGGDGVASDEILNAARELSRKKPMVISMSDYAASGGYYISMTGDPIVAYPNTLTGSIGVIYNRFSARGLYNKLGIQKDSMQHGKYAGIDSDYEPLSADGQKKVEDEIERFYQGFLKRVAEGRRRKPEDIDLLAQGRVWLGTQALDNGLVDELGGLDRAIEMVKKKAGIAASARITLVPYPAKRSLLELLLSSRDDQSPSVETMAGSILGTWETRKLAATPVGAEINWLEPAARLLAGGGVMELMPYRIEVR
jgi:protease-4